MAKLSRNQQLFAAAFAQASGLDPHAIEAWMIAEEPAGASSGYKGTQDWLNIGITDSGPMGAGNTVWQDPVKAGIFSAKWMAGKVSDPGFGTAAPGIQAIMRTAGKSPQAQLTAIANSPWATSHYGGAGALISLLGQVGGKLPNVNVPASSTSPGTTGSVGKIGTVKAPVIAGPNLFTTLSGLEAARQAVGGDTSGQPDALQQGWDTLAALIAPSIQGSSGNILKVPNSVRNNMGNPATGGKGVPGQGDLNPLQGWSIGRTDMGVDASAHIGKPILAPNNSRVVHVYPGWFAGQPYVLFQLTSGPNKGRYYYVSEQIDHVPAVGSYVPRGGVIARFAASGTGIEMGWGTPTEATKAQATTGYTEGQVTPAGQDFKHTFGINLRTSATPRPVAGTLPLNQPSTPTTPLPKAAPSVNPSLVNISQVPSPKAPSILDVPSSKSALPELKLPKVA